MDKKEIIKRLILNGSITIDEGLFLMETSVINQFIKENPFGIDHIKPYFEHPTTPTPIPFPTYPETC